MKSNPILEEVWRVKEQLAADSGYDVGRFFEQLQEWSAAHPHSGRIINTSEELRKVVTEKERRAQQDPAIFLNDKPRDPSTS